MAPIKNWAALVEESINEYAQPLNIKIEGSIMELTEIKKEHDRLLAEIPSGVDHDAANCPICTEDTDEGGDMSTIKTYTQDELDAAIAGALTPLQKQIEEFAGLEQVKVVEAKVAEAVAPLEDQISELQKTLDTTTARAEAAEKNHSDLVSKIEADTAAEEAAKEREGLKTTRLELVKEAASFKDEYIASHIDRWTDMSEEAFTACVEDWKAVAVKPEPTTDPLATTAMKAVREDKTDQMSDFRTLAMMTLSGSDIKSV